jgi:glycosyltransferase involved in cell wall biosynthesis
VFNGERFLGEALESVFAQKHRPLQVIVVDDGSTDGTAEVVRSFEDVEYIYQENQGVSAARNRGLEKARGEMIAFLDADDLWKPEKLEKQMQFMTKHPECRISSTDARNFLEEKVELPQIVKSLPDWEEVRPHLPSTLLVEKGVFEEIGPFDTGYAAGEDTEWQWRARDYGFQICRLEEELTLRRFHGKNLSWKEAAGYKARHFRIVRESIARKSRLSEQKGEDDS